jgi:DNA-binding transcriptional MerR regulator
MRIGELAARAGVSVRSVRYYEEQGLLTSTRSPSGQRLYTDDEVERVRFLQRLYGAGLSSRTISEVLPCVDSPSDQTTDEAFDRLLRERERINEPIENLLRTRDALDRLIAANRAHRAGSAEACPPAADGEQPGRASVTGRRR